MYICRIAWEEPEQSRAQPAGWNAQMSEFIPDGVDDPRPQSPGGRQISNSGSLGTSPTIHNLRLMILSQKSNRVSVSLKEKLVEPQKMC